MPEISSVDSAVEKMVQKAPVEEQAASEAPAKATPAAAETTGEASTSEESTELSAFEQELIEEFKEEYDQVPEGDRKAFLNALKRSYRKNAKQMTELGTLRKAVGALRDHGVTNEDLVELIQRKRGNGKVESKPTEATERGFRRWMAKSTDPAEKENLREAEQVIQEMVEDLLSKRIEEIRDKEVKPLKDRLDLQERQALGKRAQSLEQDISDLEDKLGYPGSLVETHREAMKTLGLRDPDADAEELLVRAAGFQTVKAAMLKVASAKGTTENGAKTAPASVVKKPSAEPAPKNERGIASVSKVLDMIVRPKR